MEIKLNEHATGIILKELVRKALKTIRRETFVFEATHKEGYDGSMNDVFTSADTKAQDIYESSIKECFPGVGLIGEEGLNIPCTLETPTYITIDPLDGTRAFIRRQSHGVSTMIALVENEQVISAWIGDTNTQEIYGYKPKSDDVYRITELDISENLTKLDRTIPLSKFCILMRSAAEGDNNHFKNIESLFIRTLVDGSSIGTWFARLWKGEIGALHMGPGTETPWDSTPVIGISQKLGFIFLRPKGESWEEYRPTLVTEIDKRDHQTIIVHRTHIDKFVK